MTKTVSTAELRRNIAKYLRLVTRKKGTVLVKRYDKVVAALGPR